MHDGPTNLRYFALVYKFPVRAVGSSLHVTMGEFFAANEISEWFY